MGNNDELSSKNSKTIKKYWLFESKNTASKKL